jgi:tetratricopeptide (TPR) repeat protein
VLLCFGIAFVCVSAAVGVVLSVIAPQQQANRGSVEPPPPDPQLKKDVQAAFGDARPVNDEELLRELKPFFATVGADCAKLGPQGLISHLDVDRLVDEILTLPMVPANIVQNRQQFAAGMKVGMTKQAAGGQLPITWTRADIKHAKWLNAQEAVVIVRHQDAFGNPLRIRWWLTKRSGAWQIYDLQDLDAGLRVSTVIGSVTTMKEQEIAAASQAMQTIREASDALNQRGDVAAAAAALGRVPNVKLPKAIEGMRWCVEAAVRAQQGKDQAALEAIALARACHPDMPCLDLLEGIVHNNLGKWDHALKCLEQYRGLLGEDGLLCAEIAQAQQGLGRRADAAANYRKALDFEPANGEFFLQLLQVLDPQAGRDDLGPRFAKLPQPQQHFERFAEDCRVARDHPSLVELCQAMMKIDSTYAPADFYLALVRAEEQRTKDALALFAAALKKQKDAGKRQDYSSVILPAIVPGGGALPAYALAPDARQAFGLLAEPLKNAGRKDELRELVALHARAHPDDPALALYRDGPGVAAPPPRRLRRLAAENPDRP